MHHTADAEELPEAVIVRAPAAGWLWPLSEAGDPAFAHGLLGPGVALDPLSPTITAPFDGEIVTLNPSRHAVVIRHASGVEVLVHVGIDTVELEGQGFVAHVCVGNRVAAGAPLITTDLSFVAQAGKSLITPVVVVAPAGVRLDMLAGSSAIKAGAALFAVQGVSTSHDTAIAAPTHNASLTVMLPHGLHARPAAALTQILRETGSSGTLCTTDRSADIASMVALMRAEIAYGERIEVGLSGPRAAEALTRITAILRGDFAEAAPTYPTPTVRSVDAAPAANGLVAGLTGAPGLAVGVAFRHQPQRYALATEGGDQAGERAALAAALAATHGDLAVPGGSTALDEVHAAHRQLLDDPELLSAAQSGISKGQSAGYAWSQAIDQVATAFAAGGVRLAERQADLRDLRGRVLFHLGVPTRAQETPPAGAIVLADDLLPSELASYAKAGAGGVALAGASPTAHVAIIAAGLGLPLLAGCGSSLALIPDGGLMVLDATAGILNPAPSSAELVDARTRLAAAVAAAEADRAAACAPALTLDGAAIAVHANLGGTADAARAISEGAEGCGLLRSEFLFLDRDTPPDEDEQSAAYGAILAALEGRPLTLRTLDIGGDKPVRFLPSPAEENPALGLRGIRVGLAHPDLLATQLRAALHAAANGPLEIMVPMIAGMDEWRAVRTAVAQAAEAVGHEAPVRLGLMIETPAAVLLADRLASEADFFSIGSNDLTQYVLAMDRTNQSLAPLADALHPAVLRAIAAVVTGAGNHNCPVSLCGGMASDPMAIPLLVGIGVTKLSVVPAAVPATKRIIRTLDRQRWADLARNALELDTAAAVRTFVQTHMTCAEYA